MPLLTIVPPMPGAERRFKPFVDFVHASGWETEFVHFDWTGPQPNFGSTALFAQAGKFSEGLAPVRIFRKWGYLSAGGELAIKALFDRAKPFSEGLAAVALTNDEGDTVWGYIDREGRMRIKPRFETAGGFRHGLAKVSVIAADGEKRAFHIDRKGIEQEPRHSRN